MWPQLAAFALSAWLIAAPGILGYDADSAARTNDHVVGPIAAAFALVAASEVTRAVRWVNAAIGVWLLLSPWFLAYTAPHAANTTGVAIGLIACSCFRGRVTETFGGGWRVLWNPDAGGHARAVPREV
jgi:hypothetical protein